MSLPTLWAYALETEWHTGAEVIKLYFSTDPPLVTKSTDTPPSTTFRTGLKQPGNYDISAFRDGKTYGKAAINGGEIILDNFEGQYDFLRTYAADGRPAVLRRIDPALMAAAAYPADWTTVFTGSLNQPLPAVKGYHDETISIPWRDLMVELQVPLPLAVYKGNNVLPNGLEGTANDLINKAKQLIIGQVYEASMQCVNTAKLIYAASPPTGGLLDLVTDFWSEPDIWSIPDFFGTILAGMSTEDIITDWWSEPDIWALEDIFGVRRSGFDNATVHVSGLDIPQETPYTDENDMMTNEPTAGYCRLLKTHGYVRFTTAPSGPVTVCCTDASGARNSIGSLIRSILRDYMRWDKSKYNLADLVRIDVSCPYPMGKVIQDSNETVDQLLDYFCQSAGVCYYRDPTGVLRVFQIVDPATLTADFVLTGRHIRSVNFLNNDGIPAKGVRLKQQRNWTVQSSGLAATVTAARRAWLAQEWRENLSTNSTTAKKHLLSKILEIETAFAVDVQPEADRIKDLYSIDRDFMEAELDPLEFDFTTLRMGMVGNLQLNDRLGYTAKNMLLLGITADLGINKNTLLFWG